MNLRINSFIYLSVADILYEEKVDLAIVGWHDGGAGQVQAWLMNDSNFNVNCFVNTTNENVEVDGSKVDRDARQFSYPTSTSFKGLPLISGTDWAAKLLQNGVKNVLVTTPNLRERQLHISEAKAAGLRLTTIIHPTAYVAEDAFIGESVLIYPRTFIGYRAEVYDGVSINTGSQIDHHNVIRDCACIDPGVVTAGNVTLGECSQVHTGATIKNRIRIGKDVVIGAGAVVIRDVKMVQKSQVCRLKI